MQTPIPSPASGSLFSEGNFNPPQFLKVRGEENKGVYGLQGGSVGCIHCKTHQTSPPNTTHHCTHHTAVTPHAHSSLIHTLHTAAACVTCTCTPSLLICRTQLIQTCLIVTTPHTINPHSIISQSPLTVTPHSYPSVTPHSYPSVTSVTPHSYPSVTSVTPHSYPSQSPFSHPPQLPLSHLSHPPQLPLSHLSHPSQLPLTVTLQSPPTVTPQSPQSPHTVTPHSHPSHPTQLPLTVAPTHASQSIASYICCSPFNISFPHFCRYLGLGPSHLPSCHPPTEETLSHKLELFIHFLPRYEVTY